MSLFSQIDLLHESKISLDERKNVPLVISDGTLVLILLFHVTSSLFTYFYAVIFSQQCLKFLVFGSYTYFVRYISISRFDVIVNVKMSFTKTSNFKIKKATNLIKNTENFWKSNIQMIYHIIFHLKLI